MADTYGLPIWVDVELKHAGEGLWCRSRSPAVLQLLPVLRWLVSQPAQPVLSRADSYLLSLSLLRAVLFPDSESAAMAKKTSPAPQPEPGSGLRFLSFSLLC